MDGEQIQGVMCRDRYTGEDLLQKKSAVLSREVTPDDLQGTVSTPAGSERVIRASFIKAMTGKRWNGESAETSAAIAAADAFLEDLTWPEQQLLAVRLSGLVSEMAITEWLTNTGWKEKPRPNGGAGETSPQTTGKLAG